MSDTTFIYTLADPVTRMVRYVGKSDNPHSRLDMHISDARTKGHYCANWIRSLLQKNLRPIIEIVDEVIRSEWQAAEAAYIIFYRDEGNDLVNWTPGGDGTGSGCDHPRFGKTHTPETLEKMRAAKKGKRQSQQSRAKMSAARSGEKHHNFGRITPSEVRDKIRKSLTGKKQSPEQVSRMIAAVTGLKRSPETKARMSASRKRLYLLSPEFRASFLACRLCKRKSLSPETLAKMRIAQLGRKASLETRSKMFDSRMKYFSRQLERQYLDEMWD